MNRHLNRLFIWPSLLTILLILGGACLISWPDPKADTESIVISALSSRRWPTPKIYELYLLNFRDPPVEREANDLMHLIFSECMESLPQNERCVTVLNWVLKSADINAVSDNFLRLTPLQFSVISCAPEAASHIIAKGGDPRKTISAALYKGLNSVQLLAKVKNCQSYEKLLEILKN